MEGTLAAVRGIFERVHREIRPPFERLFLRGIPRNDDGGKVLVREILSLLEAEADCDKRARR